MYFNIYFYGFSLLSVITHQGWMDISFFSFAFYYTLTVSMTDKGRTWTFFSCGPIMCQSNNWTWHVFENGYIFTQISLWYHSSLPPFRQTSVEHSGAWEDCIGHEKSSNVLINHVLLCTQLLAQGVDLHKKAVWQTQGAGSIESLEPVWEAAQQTDEYDS